MLCTFLCAGFNDLTDDEKARLGTMIPSLFLFSIVWSLGASCDKGGRALFDSWMRERVEQSDLGLPEGAMLPAESTVYEWCYDQEAGQWVEWMSTIPDFKCDPDMPFSEVRGGRFWCGALAVVQAVLASVSCLQGSERGQGAVCCYVLAGLCP